MINKCYLTAKILSKIEYKFMLEKNMYAKVEFIISLERLRSSNEYKKGSTKEKNLIKANSYNYIADSIYRNLNIEDIIFIEGRVQGKSIIIERYNKLFKCQNKKYF